MGFPKKKVDPLPVGIPEPFRGFIRILRSSGKRDRLVYKYGYRQVYQPYWTLVGFEIVVRLELLDVVVFHFRFRLDS